MMHHREKKNNNIYISSGAFWCIGALRCIWCICTTLPLAAISQSLSTPEARSEHISIPTKNDDVCMRTNDVTTAFKTRLHNDMISTQLDINKLKPNSHVKIFYAHDITTDTLTQITKRSIREAINFHIDADGHYLVYTTAKLNQDTLIAIYQVINSNVIVYKKQKYKSKILNQ